MNFVPTPTQAYIQALQSGPCPSAFELRDLCKALHAATVDNLRESLWMDRSFENMADTLTDAIECADPSLEDLDEIDRHRHASNADGGGFDVFTRVAA